MKTKSVFLFQICCEIINHANVFLMFSYFMNREGELGKNSNGFISTIIADRIVVQFKKIRNKRKAKIPS